MPFGFQAKLGLVRGKFLPAALHVAEAFYVSSSSINAIGAVIVRSVWSTRMPLACTPAILNVLNGIVDVDPAKKNVWSRFCMIVWSRFRVMRRYLACCLEEKNWDFSYAGSYLWGHGPVDLLISATEIGFAWNSGEQGWVRVSLPLLRVMTGPIPF